MADQSARWLAAPQWLAANLGDPGIVVIHAALGDARPGVTARDEYAAGHIAGAVLVDIEDGLSDTATDVPTMLPDPAAFAAAMGARGVGSAMRAIVYAPGGIGHAARMWWMLRAMGHDAVAVLDGSLAEWRAAGHPVATGHPAPRPPAVFTATLRPELVRDLAAMQLLVAEGGAQIVDARSAARYAGAASEPRPVPRYGHMPGASNLPYTDLTTADGRMRPAAEIERLIAGAGIDPAAPLVATCGSGVTACVVALGLALIGQDGTAVYDGSWAEWSRSDGPVVAAG